MKRIHQEHGTGCGIAYIAMLSRATYAETMSIAAKVLNWSNSKRTFYKSSSQLQRLLSEMNISSMKGRSIRKWSSLPDTAIIGINHNEKNNTRRFGIPNRINGE